MKVLGKTAVVIGGASGMGNGAARLLAERGARVAILSFEEDSPRIAAELAAETGGEIVGWQLDMENREQVYSVLDAVVEKFGGIDISINTAGQIDSAKVTEPEFLPLLERMLSVNLVGTLNAVDACVRIMRRNVPDEDGERGVILVTGSMASLEGVPGQAPYCASKAGLLGVVLPVAREMAGEGIRINAIEPGGFETPLTARLSRKFKDGVASGIPNPQRLGVPDDYAVFALALIEAKYANAGTFRLDGGWRQVFP
ncbi:3-hydroxyacyl-CoA dehydrogenase/3-hydroxy-2-methylbutyryl-CoA dehydrogenase [Rhodococcus sp. 27YEA15]|uniref:SDR family NAD(P)-dependent oxidoreductase n=1 Tax=Rhodococcus sp. 27YEA15 TaxID=3156259 RepID=UPI003C7A7728